MIRLVVFLSELAGAVSSGGDVQESSVLSMGCFAGCDTQDLVPPCKRYQVQVDFKSCIRDTTSIVLAVVVGGCANVIQDIDLFESEGNISVSVLKRCLRPHSPWCALFNSILVTKHKKAKKRRRFHVNYI